MKKKLLPFLILTTMVLCLTGCGLSSVEEGKEVTGEESVENFENENSLDILNDKEISDEARLLEFNEKIRGNERWNLLFEKRCFYVDGIKVYMPTTVKEYQELFNTEFTGAYLYNGSSMDRTCGIEFKDENNNGCTLVIWDENDEFPSEPKDLVEFCLDKEVVGIIPKKYANDFFTMYNITFENVENKINEYGYYYGGNIGGGPIEYIPEEIMAYLYYINGELPTEMQGNGYIEFNEITAAEFTVEDMTADGIAELIFSSELYGYGFAYDKQNHTLNLIYEGDMYNVKIDENLYKESFYDERTGDEYAYYYLYHIDGSNELLVSQYTYMNEETCMREYYINDQIVTKEEYDDIASKYGIPRRMGQGFLTYSEESLIDMLSTEACVYYNSIEDFKKDKDNVRYQPYVGW